MGNKRCWCGREAIVNSKTGLCVFHAPNDEKEARVFWQAFNELYQRALEKRANNDTDDNEVIKMNCCGFVFPKFGFGEFPKEVPFLMNFTRAVFEFGADFSNIVFLEDVYFDSAYFGGPPTEGETIERRINTNLANHIAARFYKSTFQSLVRFCDTEFYCPAIFRRTSFVNTGNSSAEFIGTIFYSEAIFSGSSFIEPAQFYGVLFGGKTEFIETCFSSCVEFDYAIFKGKTDFDSAESGTGISFNRAILENILSLSHLASKHEKDEFGERVRGPWGYPIPIEREVRLLFQNCDPKPGAKMKFNGTTLKYATFANTPKLEDFHTFDFEGAVWKDADDKRKIVFDEVLAEEEENGGPTYEETAEVYRRLRLNYESRLAYEFASDFHVGQMLMMLKSLNKRNPKKWFLWLYRYVSNFGESVGRPLLWFGGLWLLFSFLWSFNGFAYNGGKVNFDLAWPWLMSPDFEMAKDVGRCLLYSFKTFLTLPDLKGGVISQTIGAVQRLAGASVITLFILALRRAFRR